MEEQSSTIHNTKEFVVVMRGPSGVMFHKGDNLIAVDFPSSIGPVRITLATRWLNKGEGITVPGHLWIDIRGNGPSLENALVPFANAGLSLLPIISISANAAIGEPDVELGFDNTPGIKERDYFQSYIPPETNTLYNARNINIEATVAVLRALDKHPDAERLRRCTNQYRLSLDSWRLGRESLALAHLWMALEALTTAKVRAECQARKR